jgi:hypothetical protein
MKIGIVSDTHGLFRPEVAAALAGVSRILHLGDVGRFSVIEELRRIAPVVAVRGNVDREGPCSELPATEVTLLGEHYVYMLHDLHDLHLDPVAGKFAVVLSGHTHVANYVTRRGVLYFNPGSCGPRRFELQPTVGILTLTAEAEIEPQIIPLRCD